MAESRMPTTLPSPVDRGQSRKLERKPFGTASIFRSRSSPASDVWCSTSPLATERRYRERPTVDRLRRGLPGRWSTSGTRCSRPAFMRSSGIVQTAPSRSISFHSTPGTSPEGRQHQELEGEPGFDVRIGAVDAPQGCAYLGLGQRALLLCAPRAISARWIPLCAWRSPIYNGGGPKYAKRLREVAGNAYEGSQHRDQLRCWRSNGGTSKCC